MYYLPLEQTCIFRSSKGLRAFKCTLFIDYFVSDLLKKSGPSRIVNVSSAAYVFGLIDFNDITKLPNYLPKMFDYCNSKLLILYSTLAWAEKLKDYGVTVNCLHPGGVRSNIMLRLKSDITIKIFDVLYYFIHPWIKVSVIFLIKCIEMCLIFFFYFRRPSKELKQVFTVLFPKNAME